MPQNAKVGQLLSQKSRVEVRLSGAQYVEKKNKYRDSPDSTVFAHPGNLTIEKTVLIGD